MPRRASGATETIMPKIGPPLEADSQSALMVAPGCVADKLRIIRDAVGSGEPENAALLVPIQRECLGAREPGSGQRCWLPAVEDGGDDVWSKRAEAREL